MTDSYASTTPSHLTVAQRDAQNPNGQRHTMAGTTGMCAVPNSDMHSTVCKQIDPTSHMGTTQEAPK